MNKRIITVIILVMSLSITGCGGVNANQTENQTTSEVTTAGSDTVATEELDNEEEKIEENTSNKVKWLTPQIKENLPKEQPEIAYDLFTHVNYEWLRDTELRDGRKSASVFDTMADEVQETVQDLIVDEDIDEKYKIIQDTYYAFLDMDKRNEAGFSSVMPYVERIEAVKNIDEYLELILSDAEICRMTGVTGVGIDFDFEDGTMLVSTYSDLGEVIAKDNQMITITEIASTETTSTEIVSTEVTSTEITTAPDLSDYYRIYPRAAVITLVDYDTDTVYLLDYEKNSWSFTGAECWEENDVVAMVIDGKGTESHHDDEILDMRFAGTVDSIRPY